MTSPLDLVEIKLVIRYRRFRKRYLIEYIDGFWPNDIDQLLYQVTHSEEVPVTVFSPRLKTTQLRPWLRQLVVEAFPEMEERRLSGLTQCVKDVLQREMNY